MRKISWNLIGFECKMRSLDLHTEMLYTLLKQMPDFRRNQSKQFWLAEMLMVTVIAVLWWSRSYREIESFMKIHFKSLQKLLKLKRKRIPDYSTVRNIIIGCDSWELEKTLRVYADRLQKQKKWEEDITMISIDWKTMRWSFDTFKGQEAFHILSAYLSNDCIVLWTECVETHKTNEIPVAQKLIADLNIPWVVYTLDAMHLQKKR